MRDEGVIKFNCEWIPGEIPGEIPEHSALQSLIEVRNQLFQFGFIGVYPDGIGFGNLSIKSKALPALEFIISGTQTGHIPVCDGRHFTRVTGYNIEKNTVVCKGPAKASSESLTHAMIYEIFPSAHAVIHIHNQAAWRRLQGVVPTTAEAVPYGTPEMALEVRRLEREGRLGIEKIMVMAGHEDGILSFGGDLPAALAQLLNCVRPEKKV